MWVRHLLQTIKASTGLVVLVGGMEYGIAQIISSLGEGSNSLVWMEFRPRDQDDPIIQGNKLAEAVTRALGSPLFGYAMPFSYGLAVLKTHQKLLGPFTFAVSGAEYVPGLAQEITSFNREANRVLLHFNNAPAGIRFPRNTLVLDQNKLTLTLEQAEAEAQLHHPGAPRDLVEKKWMQSGGVYEKFRVGLSETLDGPMLVRPSPIGPQAVAPEPIKVNPEVVFEALVRQKRFVEALEMASSELPHRIDEVLEFAAMAMWMRGTHSFLLRQLSHLPENLRHAPTALRWQLAAALNLGREDEFLPSVQALIQTGEVTPDLLALYGQIQYRKGDPRGYLKLSKQAVELQKTPFTMYCYGHAMQGEDLEESLNILKEALRLAETQSNSYWATLSALGITQTLTQCGRYRDALDWAEWGLNVYQRESLGHNYLRLSLLNEWASARILMGDTAGLSETIRKEFLHISDTDPFWAGLLKTTLADLALVEGRAEDASRLFSEIWVKVKRRESYGMLANLWVRSLIQQNDLERARQVAERAVRLTEDLPELFRRRAELAVAMVKTHTDPETAIPTLERLLDEFSSPLLASRRAQAALYLARCYWSLGERAKAREVIEHSRLTLSTLGRGGLDYLAGPQGFFEEVFEMIAEHDTAPMRIAFLGEISLTLNGVPINLRQRFADIIVALMVNPQGLSGEQLTILVYGEDGNPTTTKADLSRLRELVPIQARPYRLAQEFTADFLEVRQLLTKGRLREALSLYRGSLLPSSDAPVVIEEREVLEEILRQAVLNSRDLESLLMLAELLRDDLEVWEAAIMALPRNDPRRVVAQARMERVAADW